IAEPEKIYPFVAFGNKKHIRKRLVMALIIGNRGNRFVGKLFRRTYFPLTDQPLYHRNIFFCIRIYPVTKTAPPYAVVVKLKTVYHSAAKTHCSHNAIAYREGFIPIVSRRLIP